MAAQPALYLLFGYPGAGKTTVAKAIEKLTDAVRLSSDEIRFSHYNQPTFSQQEHDELYSFLNTETKRLLSKGTSVIYDANLNRFQHRQEKYDIAIATGAKAVLLWVQTPKHLAKQRAMHEDRLRFATHNENLGDMFDRISGVIEQPTDTERPIILDGTKASLQYVAEALLLA